MGIKTTLKGVRPTQSRCPSIGVCSGEHSYIFIGYSQFKIFSFLYYLSPILCIYMRKKKKESNCTFLVFTCYKGHCVSSSLYNKLILVIVI